jgi:propanol-preferring alcohol dehydrogenase
MIDTVKTSDEATASTMRAWIVDRPGPIDSGPLGLVERAVPRPIPGEVLVRVEVCAVCRTDLHLAEGDLAPRRQGVVPGHEIVGRVAACASADSSLTVGDRVGVAWLHASCGVCRYCVDGRENLCVAPQFTGWDVDGGFAEYVVANEQFCYPLGDDVDVVRVAPLLCAGIIGYRALARVGLPDGGRLGLWGFGASAHLTAQVARAAGARLYVFTRSPVDRELARTLGAEFVGDSFDDPHSELDGAICFAPAGELVPVALSRLARGATLAIAGIHLSEIPPLDYERHLFYERTLRSVTANTRVDGRELLAADERSALEVTTTTYGFEDLPRALGDLAHDRFAGAAVITVAGALSRQMSQAGNKSLRSNS